MFTLDAASGAFSLFAFFMTVVTIGVALAIALILMRVIVFKNKYVERLIEEAFDVIIKEIEDGAFSLLVDESSDVSKKEQMALVLRYVDRLGIVKERFAGVVHVDDTSSKTLKASIDTLFAQHKLSLKQASLHVRGQGYDGASNMRDKFNGLKALILKDNSSAYYVHCFAHRLQLVIVAVANHHERLVNFFEKLIGVINVVSSFCKRKDMRRKLEILKFVEKEAHDARNQVQAQAILSYFKKYEFVFYLHLMEHILRATNLLSKAFQVKDQNILEAVSMINGTKESLITLRAKGFDNIPEKVNIFCTYEISTHLLSNMSALSPRASFFMFDSLKLITLTTLYLDDFMDFNMFHLIRELDLYCVNMVQNEDFSKLNTITEFAKEMMRFDKHCTFPMIYKLLKLALVLPVAAAIVERCFP
ncbi:zinc finger MYM-type protein 1-like protein [Tanacetum coccineum]|uniref:Zinc finger MYM-type protein 1-like protein n=1 Tax=Tanacetum coccineum TaxID=301880 RepID=A0ABQ5BK50_9ASTR